MTGCRLCCTEKFLAVRKRRKHRSGVRQRRSVRPKQRKNVKRQQHAFDQRGTCDRNTPRSRRNRNKSKGSGAGQRRRGAGGRVASSRQASSRSRRRPDGGGGREQQQTFEIERQSPQHLRTRAGHERTESTTTLNRRRPPSQW